MRDEAPWNRFRSEIYSLVGRSPKSNRLAPAIAELEPSHAVLDIGCGPGAAVRAAASHVQRAAGVDRSEAMIEIAKRRSRRLDNVDFAVAAAEQLPFPDNTFDRAWTIHALHHWENQAQGLAEALRVLRPSGRFLVVESETKGSHGLNRAGADELVDTLLSIGFAHAAVSKPYRQLVVTGVAGS